MRYTQCEAEFRGTDSTVVEGDGFKNGAKSEAICSALNCAKAVVFLARGCNNRGSEGKFSKVIKCWYLETRRGMKSAWSILGALARAEKSLRAFLIRSRAIDFSGKGRAPK